MELRGEYLILVSRERVWAALNDADVLRRAVPGCESLRKQSDTEFEAVSVAKIGPVKATFRGRIILSDLDPPRSYTISGEGKGGAAGFAKGRAFVELVPDADGTRLKYRVEANVGGKIAQVGQRLIDSTAKKMSDDFFAAFSALVSDGANAPAPVPAQEARGSRLPWIVGLALAAAGALVLWYWLA